MVKSQVDVGNISIILVNPETPGNIGSIARVMKNFGFTHLILFNPKKDHTSLKAQGFAMKAKDILENAEVITTHSSDNSKQLEDLKTLLNNFDIVIGTSAKGYSYRNIKRIPIFINELDLNQFSPKTKIALVFGRESTGLTNDEVFLMDLLVRIPTNPQYPTLNISQAAGIILHNIFNQISEKSRGQIRPSTRKNRDALFQMINNVINRTPIPEFRLDRTIDAFKNIIGRSFVSQKEVSLLYNFFRKIDTCYDNPEFQLDRPSNEDESD